MIVLAVRDSVAGASVGSAGAVVGALVAWAAGAHRSGKERRETLGTVACGAGRGLPDVRLERRERLSLFQEVNRLAANAAGFDSARMQAEELRGLPLLRRRSNDASPDGSDRFTRALPSRRTGLPGPWPIAWVRPRLGARACGLTLLADASPAHGTSGIARVAREPSRRSRNSGSSYSLT